MRPRHVTPSRARIDRRIADRARAITHPRPLYARRRLSRARSGRRMRPARCAGADDRPWATRPIDARVGWDRRRILFAHTEYACYVVEGVIIYGCV
jgi:hypothetical protein